MSISRQVGTSSVLTLCFFSRQVVLLCVAIFLQLLVIDFLTLRTRLFPKLLGTQISLAIAQSKGWPFVLLMWALLDMIFLYGSRRVARHWLFWQKWIQMMNATNPSGNITDSDTYKLIIYISIGLGAAVTVKRTLMGNFVGKRVVGKFYV
jgi:prepilin signal peptidase PulO-like enzyme (type II secretory pathway)